MEKFIIKRNPNNEFQFYFVDKKGNIILSSGVYTRKLMCLKGIESVKRNSQDDMKFFRKTSSNNETYFNLKAFNGKVIAVSRLYKNKVLREKGIEFLKKKAKQANIEDSSRQSVKIIYTTLGIAV